jgi:hypothetical protein
METKNSDQKRFKNKNKQIQKISDMVIGIFPGSVEEKTKYKIPYKKPNVYKKTSNLSDS